jgi:hypothetical protein
MEESDSRGMGVSEPPKISTVISGLSFYFIGVGALYLWGFWGSFNVNVMEYLGLADIVKVAAWPVLSAFVFLVLGMLAGELAPIRRLPECGGGETRLGYFLRRSLPAIKWSSILLLGGLIAFGSPTAWQGTAMILGIVLARPVRQLRSFQHLVPDTGFRTTVAYAFVVLPLFSFGQGRVNADVIKRGHSYQYVLPTSDGIVGTPEPLTSLRYVGFAGSTFFFWQPASASLSIVPSASIKSLNLRPYNKTGLSLTQWIATEFQR